jgi:hypothetical protein
MLLGIYPIDVDHGKLPHVFAMTIWRCTNAAHRQTFCSVHVGSIGRISEADVWSLMRTAVGRVSQAVIRLAMQVTDAVSDSAVDADGCCERTFERRPFTRAGCGPGLIELGKWLRPSRRHNFSGRPDSEWATGKQAWVGPALSEAWRKEQGAGI